MATPTAHTTSSVRVERGRSVADVKGLVDFGILTIREDEFEAVLERLPPFEIIQGRRDYNLHRLALPGGGSYLVAIVKCIEQGNTEALDAARDLLEELAPQWLLVVGIAGGVPSDETSLGDVVVSTRIVDFSVEAVLQDERRTPSASACSSSSPRRHCHSRCFQRRTTRRAWAGWRMWPQRACVVGSSPGTASGGRRGRRRSDRGHRVARSRGQGRAAGCHRWPRARGSSGG